MSKSELACAYAAMLLADDDVDVTADKISTILKAANIKFVEPYMPGLFALALQGKNVKDLFANVGAAGAAAPMSAPAGGAAPSGGASAAEKSKEEEKKKEESEDSDDDFNLDLFG